MLDCDDEREPRSVVTIWTDHDEDKGGIAEVRRDDSADIVARLRRMADAIEESAAAYDFDVFHEDMPELGRMH